MNVTAMLCDHAQVSSDGKLFIAGAGITRLGTSKAEPPLVVSISLALVVEIGWSETNTMHRLLVELVFDDPAGAQAVKLPLEMAPNAPAESEGCFFAEFNAGRAPDMLAGESTLLPVALQLAGLELPAPGSYFFSIKVDGEEAARAQFRVVVPVNAFGGFGAR